MRGNTPVGVAPATPMEIARLEAAGAEFPDGLVTPEMVAEARAKFGEGAA